MKEIEIKINVEKNGEQFDNSAIAEIQTEFNMKLHLTSN